MDHLTTEQPNPDSSRLDEMSASEIVGLMNSEDATIAAAIAKQQVAIARAIGLIADRLRAGGRLFYIGAGTSGRLGVLDASECPPTFRTPPEMVVGIIAGGNPALTRAIEGAEDDPAQGAADLASHRFNNQDILVGITTSGRTPYVLGAMQHARQTGATVIGLSCNRDSEMEQHADVMIAVVVGPEIISGSTRLKSGTATKLVLNMLSTGAMVLLGKTWGNLMVDLRATNAKLTDRSIRIVRQLTGVSVESAREHLAACDGSVKQTIVAIQRQVTPARAGELLAHAQGRLRTALTAEPVPSSPLSPACSTDINNEPLHSSSLSPALTGERAGVRGPVSTMLYLGIDGGGTKTTAILGRAIDDDQLKTIGHGTSGPSNPNSVGIPTAIANIQAAIDGALDSAPLPRQKIHALHAGIAGTSDPAVAQSIASQLRSRQIADLVFVCDDVGPVIESARLIHLEQTGNDIRCGIALVAGTGSIAFGYLPDGTTIRAGGWGPLLGDEGSGYAIALSGLRAACRAADGRASPTPMLKSFLDQLRLAEPHQLKSWIHHPSTGKHDIAALAPIVFDHLEHDPTARTIIDHAAGELAALVLPLVHRLDSCKGDWILALSGGLLVHQLNFRARVLELLQEHHVRPAGSITVPAPALGSLFLALSQSKPA